MKWPGVYLFSAGWDASPSQGFSPPTPLPSSIKFTSTHLYTENYFDNELCFARGTVTLRSWRILLLITRSTYYRDMLIYRLFQSCPVPCCQNESSWENVFLLHDHFHANQTRLVWKALSGKLFSPRGIFGFSQNDFFGGGALASRLSALDSWFEPRPRILSCVLGQDTLLWQCLSPPRCVDSYW